MPLWKDLKPVVDIISAQDTDTILKIDFALSKRPHLYGAYLVTVCRVLSTAGYSDDSVQTDLQQGFTLELLHTKKK